jgi:hypothetical protein
MPEAAQERDPTAKRFVPDNVVPLERDVDPLAKAFRGHAFCYSRDLPSPSHEDAL